MVQVTPKAIATIGWRFYVIFAVLNASFLLPIYLFLPETAGLPLESVDALFKTDNWTSTRRDRAEIDPEAQLDSDVSSIAEDKPSVADSVGLHEHA